MTHDSCTAALLIFCAFGICVLFVLLSSCHLRESYCLVHKQTCALTRFGCGLLHVAGTPCIDYSLMGTQQGSEGPTTGSVMAWTGQRKVIQEPVIIAECVVEFGEWVYLDALPMYFVDYTILSPSDLGWPIARQRKWCV